MNRIQPDPQFLINHNYSLHDVTLDDKISIVHCVKQLMGELFYDPQFCFGTAALLFRAESGKIPILAVCFRLSTAPEEPIHIVLQDTKSIESAAHKKRTLQESFLRKIGEENVEGHSKTWVHPELN